MDWGKTDLEHLSDGALLDLARASHLRLVWELARRLEAARKAGEV